MRESIKVAVIGAGKWGQNIVRTFHELGALGVVAEPSEGIRAQLKLQYPGIVLHKSYEPILGDSSIDAVAVVTPAPTHHCVASAALEAGKDVFVEKPMTLTSVDARELVEKAELKEKILMVGHLLLFQPAIQFIKKYLDEHKLGSVYSIHQERLKLGRARTVENVTWSFGVHDIAVLLHLIGELPIAMHASGHSAISTGVEDDVYLHMSFASGSKAHLHSSWLWPENRRRLTLVGQNGMLVYDESKGAVMLDRKTIDRRSLKNIDGEKEYLLRGYGKSETPLTVELRHFLDCVSNRRVPLTEGKRGLEVITALEQISYL